MLHLPADRLAELVDTEPTAQELAHLQLCAACARERDAYAALRSLALAESGKRAEPLLSWEQLRGGLTGAGMISDSPSWQPSRRTVRRRLSASQWVLRAAAVFLLVATGVAFGRYSERAGIATSLRLGSPSMLADERTREATPAGRPSFASEADAVTALLRAQEDYQRAAAFLVASDTTFATDAPMMFTDRLAALDELIGVTRSALSRAPHDPVINSYFLATLGAREATMQQLQLALPEGTSIERF